MRITIERVDKSTNTVEDVFICSISTEEELERKLLEKQKRYCNTHEKPHMSYQPTSKGTIYKASSNSTRIHRCTIKF